MTKKGRGFSLLELMIVIAISLTVASIGVLAIMPVLKQDHLDTAYETTLSLMRTYRTRAVAESSRYVLTFTAPGTINVQTWGYVAPPAVSPAPVNVPGATYTLPSDISFAVQASFPNPGPDNFGTGATAIGFNTCGVIEAGAACLVFYPDGSVQDDAGNYNSGIIYLTRSTSNKYQSRAITVFGTTGRARGWRLYNQSGADTWVQQ